MCTKIKILFRPWKKRTQHPTLRNPTLSTMLNQVAKRFKRFHSTLHNIVGHRMLHVLGHPIMMLKVLKLCKLVLLHVHLPA